MTVSNKEGFQLHMQEELPPGGVVHGFALLAHCFTCNSNFAAVRNIGRELTSIGFGVVRFDFTGLGKSEGDFADSRFSVNIDDLKSVYSFMAEQGKTPVLLIGHSLGGAAVLMAAGSLPGVKAVVTIGAPSEAVHVKQHFESALDDIHEHGSAEVHLGGRPFRISKAFVEDLNKHVVLDAVKELRKPLLVAHSPQDRVVGIANAAEIYGAAFHPKSFVSLDGADHMLNERTDSQYLAKLIAAWASRYIDADIKLTPVEEQGQGVPISVLDTKGEQVVARLDFSDGFTTEISNGSVSLFADEPLDAGGDGMGFSPYELLNAALGACTTMTLKLYAARKNWPLEEVSVFLSHERKHAADMGDGAKPQRIDHLSKRIRFTGKLSDEQRSRLLEIAARCPVHKTLLGEIRIETLEANENKES